MNKKNIIIVIAIIFSSVFKSENLFAQMIIKEVIAVYKSKIDNRIISEKEFQSFKGRHIFHKFIKGKKGGKDTILITPPKPLKKLSKKIIDKKAPLFSVTDLYGNNYDLDKLKGKVIVINFWFVACPPCIQEIPELNNIVASYQNNPNIIFLAFAKDTEELLGKFLSHTEFDYSIIANSKNIAKEYGVYAYPTHVIINKKGQITFNKVGFDEKGLSELKIQIDKVLK